MNQLLVILLACGLLLAGCPSIGQIADGDGTGNSLIQIVREKVREAVTEEKTENRIWSATELPVSVRYDRMWVYSDYAESTDPVLIEAIVGAIRNLEVGEPTEMSVEDYTDLLTFIFPDGSTLRLEFEEQNWVKDDHTRYQVEGLPRLRNLLDAMLTDWLIVK